MCSDGAIFTRRNWYGTLCQVVGVIVKEPPYVMRLMSKNEDIWDIAERCRLSKSIVTLCVGAPTTAVVPLGCASRRHRSCLVISLSSAAHWALI
jgi:hypothetical protein